MLEEIKSAYTRVTGQEPMHLVQAPGRINLIGEHTDYNLGYVLPAAIDKYIYFAIGPSSKDGALDFYALDLKDEYHGNINSIVPTDKTWVNYLLGIISEIKKQGHTLGGIQCVFGGNIPIGSGLSSSAALECGFAYGLNEMFSLSFSKMEIAKLGQASENNFLGIKSGILDQFSSVFGKKNHAISLDCRSMAYNYIPLELNGYDFMLFNTNIKHEHLTSGYNDRANDCKTAANLLNTAYGNISSLRDATLQQVDDLKMTPPIHQRARFIINENLRLQEFVIAMKSNDISKMGALLYQTHEGLSKDYEVSCLESDTIVSLCEEHPKIVGARMMGGGFGGCVLALIESEDKENVAEQILSAYNNKTNIQGESYFIQLENGVETIGI